MEKEKTCRTCFFGVCFQGGYCQCHRFPPIPVMEEGEDVFSHFPENDPQEWCGEWKERKEETK